MTGDRAADSWEMPRRSPITTLFCDVCGNEYSESEFVETIEEHLCQWCASGLDEDYDDDGFEEGFYDE